MTIYDVLLDHCNERDDDDDWLPLAAGMAAAAAANDHDDKKFKLAKDDMGKRRVTRLSDATNTTQL